ncbi:MAG: hypothetical protein WCV84_04580 [Patescibacteria group bacterium]
MWFKYVLIVFWIIGAIGTISMIGDERKPITKGMAIATVAVTVAMIFGIINYWK